MGGMGSGDYQGRRKGTTTHLRQLDIRALARRGLLYPGAPFAWSWTRNGEPYGAVTLWSTGTTLGVRYSRQVNGGDWQQRDESLAIERTHCHLGGYRAWFQCPACGRRCAILYLTPRGFRCRICGALNYPSTRQSAEHRALARMQAIRRRLGWPLGGGDRHAGKPDGMGWRTYARLVRQHDAAWVEVAQHQGRWMNRVSLPVEKNLGKRR